MERLTNEHHEFWTRSDWNKLKVNRVLRDHRLMKTIMYVPTHVDLHRNIRPIVAPDPEMGRRILNLVDNLPRRYTSLDAAKRLRDEQIPNYSEFIGKQIPFLELSAQALKRMVIK